MRDFVTSALLAATISQVVMGALTYEGTGLLCVEEELIDIFNSLNSIRTELTSSAVYTKLVTDNAAWTSGNNWWLYDDDSGGQILTGGQASLTDAITAVDDISSALPALTWSEGVALMTLDMGTEYYDAR